MVVVNSQERRVLYRQGKAAQIDFPALGKAVKTLKLGMVDAKQLAEKHGAAEFVGDLFTKEISNLDAPDAVIILGPKAAVDDTLPPEALKRLGEAKFPMFYMDYDLATVPVFSERDTDGNGVTAWRDAIGNAVRSVKGAEYTITRPRDVYFAWSDIASRIIKSKVGKDPAANGQIP